MQKAECPKVLGGKAEKSILWLPSHEYALEEGQRFVKMSEFP